MKNTILELQEQFDQAERHANRDVLQRLIAADFLSIGPKGFILNKQEWIDRHEHFKYLELETSDRDVRSYDKTVLVTNIQRNKAVYKNESIELAVRVMQVWVEIAGQWQLVGIQFSPWADDK
jgi:hypothetical protein